MEQISSSESSTIFNYEYLSKEIKINFRKYVMKYMQLRMYTVVIFLEKH
jgi:hypothetical protein